MERQPPKMRNSASLFLVSISLISTVATAGGRASVEGTRTEISLPDAFVLRLGNLNMALTQYLISPQFMSLEDAEAMPLNMMDLADPRTGRQLRVSNKHEAYAIAIENLKAAAPILGEGERIQFSHNTHFGAAILEKTVYVHLLEKTGLSVIPISSSRLSCQLASNTNVRELSDLEALKFSSQATEFWEQLLGSKLGNNWTSSVTITPHR